MKLAAMVTLLAVLFVGCNRPDAKPIKNDVDSPLRATEKEGQPMHDVSKSPNSQPLPDASQPSQVKVFLNPLHMLLAGAEKQKGRPLTREEVLEIRDKAVFIMMSPEQAEKFYKSLDAKMPIGRMNPDHIWEEWQEIRGQPK